MCQTQVFNFMISKISLKWLSVAKSTEEFLGNQTLNILSRGQSEELSRKSSERAGAELGMNRGKIHCNVRITGILEAQQRK